MREVFLYCADRVKQKEIRDNIEKDTGIKIKRVVRSLDSIKSDFGIGIFLCDEYLDFSYEFNKEDIIITLEKMEFRDWMYFHEKGIAVVDCSKDCKDLSWLLALRGVEGVEVDDSQNRARFETLKQSLKDYTRRSGIKIFSVCSTHSGVGQSTIALHSGYALKKQFPEKRIVVVDRVKQFSSLNYLVNNNNNFEKMESTSGTSENLFRDKENNIFIYSMNRDLKIIKDTSVTDILGVLDNLKKHFDIIIIDTDRLFDNDLLTILELSTTVFVVADGTKESQKVSVDFINKKLQKMGWGEQKNILVVNKCSDKNCSDNYKSVSIPEYAEMAKIDDTRLLCKGDSMHNNLLFMYHVSGDFNLDKRQLSEMGLEA